MKIFMNKRIWQKIVIALVIVLLFQFIVTSPAQATVTTIDGSALLSPVVGLFVSIADGVEGLLQSVVMQLGSDSESLIKISGTNDWWAGVIVAALFLVGTAVAIIAAIPTGGTTVLGWVAFAGSAVLTVTVSGVAYAVTYPITTKIVTNALGDTYYLPMFEISPYEIFANKVLLFDVDFFNPQDDQVKKVDNNSATSVTETDLNNVLQKLNDAELIRWTNNAVSANDKGSFTLENGKGDWEKIVGACTSLEDLLNKLSDRDKVNLDKQGGMELYNRVLNGSQNGISLLNYATAMKNAKTDGENYEEEVKSFVVSLDSTYGLKSLLNSLLQVVTGTTSSSGSSEDVIMYSTAGQLQSTIASWYKALRNIALVALLSILVYIGIRIILSSTASDKAKFKQVLGDWVVAVCLLFMMHYIMAFSMTIVNKITKIIESMSFQSENTQDVMDKVPNSTKENIKDAVELFIIDGNDKVKNAYNALVMDDNINFQSYFFTDSDLSTNADSANNANVLLWPANNFMEQARMRLQVGNEEGEDTTIMYGYAIIYVVLVIYTLIFCFTYMKRVIYMAFLTIIAPLVAVTYPIDKINDGKAQAFDAWLKEYIFNLLIQPLHLMLYFILIGSAMSFASKNIFYVVLALGFFVPAEKLLRSFFGFEKAKTPGVFAGPAGSALMMAGLNKIMNKHPKGALDSGEKGASKSSSEEGQTKAPKFSDSNFDPFGNLIGEGGEGVEATTGNVEQEQNINNQGTIQGFLDGNNNGYDTRLSQNQIEELRAEGINPGKDQEIVPQRPITNRRPITNNGANNTAGRTPISKRKRIKRALGRAGISYATGIKNKLQHRYKAKGGLSGKLKRGARMAAGIYGGAAMAAAGGIIGITSGDITKAAQYMGAGAAGGYTLGKGLAGSAVDALTVEGSIKELEKGYYTKDEYKAKEEERALKKFKTDEENLKKLQSELNMSRKEAKEFMNVDADQYRKNKIYDLDSMIIANKIENNENLSRNEAIAITKIAKDHTTVDPKNMSKKNRQELKDTFVEKFSQRNSQDANRDAENTINKLSMYYKYKD